MQNDHRDIMLQPSPNSVNLKLTQSANVAALTMKIITCILLE